MLEGVLGEVAPMIVLADLSGQQPLAEGRDKLLLNVHMGVASQLAGASQKQLPSAIFFFLQVGFFYTLLCF